MNSSWTNATAEIVNQTSFINEKNGTNASWPSANGLNDFLAAAQNTTFGGRFSCFTNLTEALIGYVLNLTRAINSTTAGSSLPYRPRKGGGHIPGDEHNAVVYIIVVLTFYSFGIVFMMIRHMKDRERELEESKAYNDYVKVARERCLMAKFRPLNRLALSALNTANFVPQTVVQAGRVTYV